VALMLAAAVATSRGRVAAANLVRSDPADQSTLSAEPARVTLSFDGRIVGRPGSFIQVMVNNESVTLGQPRVDAVDGTTFSVALRPGVGGGLYIVSWKTKDFGDASVSAGVLTFSVGNAQPAQATRRDGQIAHASRGGAPIIPFAPGGKAAKGDGQLQLNGAGGAWAPWIFLENVTPNTMYQLQVCTQEGPGVQNCSDPTMSPNLMSSDSGVIIASFSLAYGDRIDVLQIVNPDNADDTYVALIGGQPDMPSVTGDPLVAPPSPLPPDSGS
jgi:methionine-rich copper-binding protein CopC